MEAQEAGRTRRRPHSHRTPLGIGMCLTSHNLFCGLAVLPIINAVLISSAVFICYAVAVDLNHVSPVFPYVSYLGSMPPEGNIFAQLMNCAAIIVSAITYTRFLQFDYEYTGADRHIIKVVNKVSAWIGLAGTLAFSMVANFPDIYVYHIDTVHEISSIAAFVITNIYFYIQTGLSFRARGILNGMAVCITRLIISILITILLITTSTTGATSYKQFHGKNDKKWGKNEGGYTLHIISAVAEWLLVFTMMSFYLTFVNEFKRNHLTIMLNPENASEDDRYAIRESDQDQPAVLGSAIPGEEQDLDLPVEPVQ